MSISPENPTPVSTHSPPILFLRPWKPLIYFFVLVDLPVLDVLCKWNHTYVAFYVWVLSLSMYCFKVHPCHSMYHHFIPFQGWIKFHHIDILPLVYWFTSWHIFMSFIHFGYYHSHSSQPCQIPYPLGNKYYVYSFSYSEIQWKDNITTIILKVSTVL